MNRSRLPSLLLAFVLATGGSAALAARHLTDPGAEHRRPTIAAAALPRGVEEVTLEQPSELAGVIVPAMGVELAAAADGRIATVAVALGDEIAAGSIVATLESAGLRHELAMARAQLQRLRAEARIAEVDLAEASDVVTRRVAVVNAVSSAISSEQLKKTQFAQQRARAAVQASRARVVEQSVRVTDLTRQLDEAQIRAPFAAHVAARHVDPGAFIARGTPVVKLVDSRQRIRFGVPVEAVGDFRVGTSISIRVEGADLPIGTRVDAVAPVVDGAARLVFIEATLPADSERLLGRRAFVSRGCNQSPASAVSK